jgi:hypothetical protein
MKKFMAQAVVVLAIFTSFTVNAEAQTAAPQANVIVASTTASIGVLARS